MVSTATPEKPSGNMSFTKKSNVGVTDSMIVHDRSRVAVGYTSTSTESSGDYHKAPDAPLKLAGPMLNSDVLYVFCIVLTIMSMMLACIAIFNPYWFTYYVRRYNKEVSYGLFDSKPCESRIDGCSEPPVCSGGCFIGRWVVAVQAISLSGLIFIAMSAGVQTANLCITLRNALMHSISLHFMASGAFLMMIAGHIVHNRSVWTDVPTKDDAYVRINPLGAGLMHVTTVLGAWVCVLTHVSSHAPGPLSLDTRFAHTYDVEGKRMPPALMLAPEEMVPEPAPPLHLMLDYRKGSIHSTAV